MTADDLRDLVDAASRGDESAWDGLVHRFAGLVWHVVRSFRLADATAEDVYQTTWLRLAENLDRIREPGSLAGWLSRTARNECLRAIRLADREQAGVDIELPDTAAPSDQVVADETSEVLWRAFSALSTRCQRLLRLLVSDPPVPYEVISETFDMPIGSIGPTRIRCLERLRAMDPVRALGGLS